MAWLHKAPTKPRPLRDEVFVRLGLLLPGDPGGAEALLEEQRRLYLLQLADLTRQKLALGKEPGVHRLRRELLLDAALLHAEADLKWLEICQQKLHRH